MSQFTARTRDAFGLLALAVLLGIATGLVEGLVLWTKHWAFGQVIFVSRHVLWMTPVVYAVIFGILGVAFGVAALVVPRLATKPVIVFALVSFGIGCLLLPVGQLNRIAAALLAAGVGFQAAQLSRRDPARARRLLARASLGLTGVVCAAGLTGEVLLRTDSSGYRGPVTAEGAGVVNVLVIVWDTVRAESLSLYGHERATTPRLDRLAAESVVFDRAFSASPWTLPGHATLFTGRLPHELSASWFQRLDDAQPTLAEVFRLAGHATGGFVANHNYTAYDSGLARGFDVYRDYRLSLGQLIRSSAFTQTSSGARMIRARSLEELWGGLREANWSPPQKRDSDRKHSDELNQQFLAWVEGLGGRPFFGFINYFDAHEGYWSPPEFRERFPRGLEGGYESAIAYQDDRVGLLLDELQRRGILDNTIVVITSDHGELLGEHGLFGHAKALYVPLLHVPLMVRYPAEAPQGRRVSTAVSLRDVGATILDLAGLRLSSPIGGASLRHTWGGESTVEPQPLLAEVEEGRNNPPEDPISRGDMQTVLSQGWQLILNGDGVEELYAYEGRPGDETNLIDDPEARPQRDALRAQFDDAFPGLRGR
jgi:arylsulfatase A-like enzyme